MLLRRCGRRDGRLEGLTWNSHSSLCWPISSSNCSSKFNLGANHRQKGPWTETPTAWLRPGDSCTDLRGLYSCPLTRQASSTLALTPSPEVTPTHSRSERPRPRVLGCTSAASVCSSPPQSGRSGRKFSPCTPATGCASSVPHSPSPGSAAGGSSGSLRGEQRL